MYDCPTNAPYSNWAAGDFTPKANYTLTNAQVIVSGLDSSDPTFNAFLYANSTDPRNPNVPGSAIEQIGFGRRAATIPPGRL